MINLSVNINKVATLRNARGGNVPDVQKFATDCELFGANGITVHPRPDERHIRRSDVFTLRPLVKTEFNIEGYPSDDFMNLVLMVKPEQVTLVPDTPAQLTSNSGWTIAGNEEFLTAVVDRLREAGIRSSIFVDTDLANIKAAAATGADRIELYTEPFAVGKSNRFLHRCFTNRSQLRPRCECRSRPQPPEPGVLRFSHALPPGSLYRALPNLRRSISGHRKHHQGLPQSARQTQQLR